MCRVISCVLGKLYLLWQACSLDKTLLASALLCSPRPNLPIILGIFWLFKGFSGGAIGKESACQWRRCKRHGFKPWIGNFCILIPFDEKGIFFLLFFIEGVVGLHRTIQHQLHWHQWLRHRLRLLWYWMIFLGNLDQSVVFEFIPKYCFSDSFVDYECYSISSKQFLPKVQFSSVTQSCLIICDPMNHSTPGLPVHH